MLPHMKLLRCSCYEEDWVSVIRSVRDRVHALETRHDLDILTENFRFEFSGSFSQFTTDFAEFEGKLSALNAFVSGMENALNVVRINLCC